MEIDLNCDLGEGSGSDADLMPLITSASIACGFHAGDASTAMEAIQLGTHHKVVLGAHPGYQDRENFGRREMNLSPEQIFAESVYQIGALTALAQTLGSRLHHVKPHGALYHQANWDPAVARPILDAVAHFGLALVGLPGTPLEAMSRNRCPYLAEGFVDRRYLPDGSLVPRSQPNAFVTDLEEGVQQVEWLIRTKGVRTLCVHGDNPHALEFVHQVRKALQNKGIVIRSYRESLINHD